MNIVLAVIAALALLALAAYAAVVTTIAHNLTRVHRRSPYTDPVWENHRADRITFTPRGGRPLKLAGWYLRGDRATRAIVLVHGKDCCRGAELKTNSRPLVDALLARGFAVLLFDLRGHGESDSARMTYGIREQRDVLGAVDWLLDRNFQPGAIGLFGASMGGTAAVSAAAQETAVGAIVADSAYADFNDMMQRRFSKHSGLPLWFLPGSLLAARLFTRCDFRKHDLRNDAGRIGPRPMLVIHTDADPIVPVAHAEQLALVAGARLWITRGEEHLSSFMHHSQAYMQRVVDFFDHHVVSERDAKSPPKIDTPSIDERDLRSSRQTHTIGRPAEALAA